MRKLIINIVSILGWLVFFLARDRLKTIVSVDAFWICTFIMVFAITYFADRIVVGGDNLVRKKKEDKI